MSASTRRVRIAFASLFFAPAVMLAFTVAPTFGHSNGGYSHDSSIGTSNPDWMASLPDQLRLSELSIPATHDSGSYSAGGDIVLTQSIDEAAQLNAGIRAFDVRCRHI